MKPDAWEAAFQGLIKQLEELQGETCGMCGRDDMGNLCVDHDHDSGLIRGLLCGRCNTVEGQHGRQSPHLWENCTVCAWRTFPAVTWLGWTVHYGQPDVVGIVQKFKPMQPMIDDYMAYVADVASRMFTGPEWEPAA